VQASKEAAMPRTSCLLTILGLIAPCGLPAQTPLQAPMPDPAPPVAPAPAGPVLETVLPTRFAETYTPETMGYRVSPINLAGGQVEAINAQKVGHPQAWPLVQRSIDRAHDLTDRCPCCGYGKTHNDMGVAGHHATKAFYFGGSCEFFSEPCRTPSKEENRLVRLWHKLTGTDSFGCSSCR
jgi:hypothetical protein